MTPENAIQLMIAVPCAVGFIIAAGKYGYKITTVFKEVMPNGGKSMKDRVVRLESINLEQSKTLQAQNKTLQHQNQELAEMKAQLRGVQDTLKTLVELMKSK